LAVLRDPELSDTAHVAVREAATRAFPAERLEALRSAIDIAARRILAEQPNDLVRGYAAPWSLQVAVLATDAPEGLSDLARQVFLAAADGNEEREAAAALSRAFPTDAALVAVQAFVALSQTLPGFLGNAWFELFRDRAQAELLRAHRELMPQAIEELLRFAGPSRAVFRKGMTLMLSEANRDPAQFPDPDRLDIRREITGHVAFGGGPHACSGAALIRMAAAVATHALLDATSTIEVSGEPERIDGFAIQGVLSLPVIAQWREIPRASD